MAHGETSPHSSPAIVSGRLPGMKRELALLLNTVSPAAPELGCTRSRSAKKTKISGADLAGEAEEASNALLPYGTPTILIHSYLPRVSSKLTLIDPKGRRERVFDINKKHNIISPSCNGLVCTYNSVSVSIFNPTTKQYLPLPKPTKGDSGWHRCLLGYLRRGSKYKVIRFFCEPIDKRPMCEVLTVGESFWRRIDTGFALSRHRHSGGVVMGGVVYSILESVKTKKSEVVSFNLADESFQIIDGPDLSKAQRCWIFEWKGRISVMQRFPSRKIQIWTLEDITTRTWTSTDRVKVECGLLDITPIVIENNILVMSGWHLHFCELEKGKVVAEIYRHDPILQGAQLHIESVVNLDAL